MQISKIAEISKKKLISIVIGLAAVVLIFMWIFSDNKVTDEIMVAKKGDFLQQVSVSGKVVASKSVDLAFSIGGRVSSVNVKVGDKVIAGRVLASVENGDLSSEVWQKQAALEAQLAKLRLLQNGTRTEELDISKSAVESAKVSLEQADQSLKNQLNNMYTVLDDAVRRKADQYFSNPQNGEARFDLTVSFEDRSKISMERRVVEGELVEFASSLEKMDSDMVKVVDVALDKANNVRDFLQNIAFVLNSVNPSGEVTEAQLEAYRLDISTARTNVNTTASALIDEYTARRSAVLKLDSAEKSLILDESGSTVDDIAIQEAQVKSARADLGAASSRVGKTIVRAPFSGVVTKVDVKVGSIAQTSISGISMVSDDTLQIETFVPEVNIPFINVGDIAVTTLDAYGDKVEFGAKVVSVDPAETIKDGVSTYRAVLQFNKIDSRVKSGMTASVLITTEKKSDVIAVPQGIILYKDGKKFLQIKNGEVFVEKQVETGSISSLGQIEVVSGLQDGDVILLKVVK